MPTTEDIETSLPLTAGAPVGRAPEGYNFLVYTTADLNEKQRETLLSDIHNHPDTATISKLAPGSYAGNSVRDVYQQHIDIRDREPKAHPTIFIIADRADWKTDGVLVLNLEARTEEKYPRHVIGVVRIAVSGALGAELICLNLEIGNMTWTDVKNTEVTEFGGEDPLSNRRYYPVDPRTAETPEFDSVVYAWYSIARRGAQTCNVLRIKMTIADPRHCRCYS